MDNRMIIPQSIDYIEDNLKTEITATELAEMAGFSLFHYYLLFQLSTGLPVMQYILRRRLLHGVYTMKQGNTKIDAALLYGFDTYAGFYKAFCLEFGTTPSAFLESSRAKRPYRIDITREEHMTVTHKKAAQILKHWNLEGETIADIYYEGTGNKNDSACYVGVRYVLKYTANLGKLKKHIAVSKALENIGRANDKWLEIYRDILWGYDSVAKLTEEERRAVPYIILANQFVCVAWFSGQDKYAEIFEINKRMTAWLIGKFQELKDI